MMIPFSFYGLTVTYYGYKEVMAKSSDLVLSMYYVRLDPAFRDLVGFS
jgi:hypothetical protein